MGEKFCRPDYVKSVNCHGTPQCDGKTHQCPLFGLPAMCVWPVAITMDSSEETWNPETQAGLAEKWLGA